MAARARILEEEGTGIPQIEHHHRIGDGGFGNVRRGLGDDGRGVLFLAFFRVIGFGRGEDRVGGLFLGHGVGGLAVAVLHPALVAAQLLFDLGQRLIEALMDVMRLAVALEDQALVDVGDDIAGIRAGPSLAESDMRAERAAEIFLDHGLQPVGHMVLQGGAGVDLVARDADIHIVVLLAKRRRSHWPGHPAVPECAG